MKLDPDFDSDLRETALRIRKSILELAFNCEGPAHLGGGLSMVEIMTLLYKRYLNLEVGDTFSPQRDRFILSKGHGVLGFYPVLAEVGIIDRSTLNTFKNNGSALIAHPVMNLELGIESSNGSLGHGLSMGVGISMAAKLNSRDYRTYVLLGDGECNEGSVWEAAMSAVQFKLNNLIAIVDNNHFQSDGISKDIIADAKLSDKWRGFGWNVLESDGHNFASLCEAFENAIVSEVPSVIMANTVKGKGISFMENNNEWHHNRLTLAVYEKALAELEQANGI